MGDTVPQTRGGLTAALAAFQAQLPEIAKGNTANVPTKTGGSFDYSYADLADVAHKVLPLLAQHGLAYLCHTTLDGDGGMVLRCELRHVSGDSVGSDWPLPANASPQALGSAITYGRRYCLLALCGAHPSNEDDDGASATATHRPIGGAARPPSDSQGDQQTPIRNLIAMARECGVVGEALDAEIQARHSGRHLADLGNDEVTAELRHFRERRRERADAATAISRQEAMADGAGR